MIWTDLILQCILGWQAGISGWKSGGVGGSAVVDFSMAWTFRKQVLQLPQPSLHVPMVLSLNIL